MNQTTASSAPMNGIQKTAILLLSLGEDVSAELIKHLDEDEVRSVSGAMAKTGFVTSAEMETVMLQFYRDSMEGNRVVRGGPEPTRRILSQALGAEAAEKHIGETARHEQKQAAAADALQHCDPQQLAGLLRQEHPQAIALLLSRIPAPRAAAVLAALPEQARLEVLRRTARLDQISPDVVEKIVGVIEQKLRLFGEVRRESLSGVRTAAELCKQLAPEEGESLLAQLAEQEEELAENIRRQMFVFEDLNAVDINALKEILGRVDRKLLGLALKGTSESLRNRFLECMSQRGAEMFLEDMDAVGPVKIKEVEGAQQQVIEAARELEKSGAISLRGGGTELYVV